MARNRQRAKQRQAARKAAGGDGADGARRPPEEAKAPAQPTEAPASGRDDVERAVDLEAGAPREDLGSPESTLEYEQDLDDYADDDSEKGVYPEKVHGEDVDHESQPTGGPRGHRGGTAAQDHSHHSRLVQFLLAVRAELQRVEWPNRQALTTLTGVVLGFVLIAGGYLGLLDAVFSRVIQSIL